MSCVVSREGWLEWRVDIGDRVRDGAGYIGPLKARLRVGFSGISTRELWEVLVLLCDIGKVPVHTN